VTTAYDQVAGTRPRVKQDVLYTRTPKGVLFHNSHAGFHLASASAYRFACAIVPRLTGRHTIAELCDGLDDGPRAMVAELVTAMLDRGFARDVPPETADAIRLPVVVAERFAPQINYVDHYTGQAIERFQRFRTTHVAVLGDDAIAQWCALSLIRNGSEAVAFRGGTAAATGFGQLADEIEELAAAGCAVMLMPLPDGQATWDDLRGYDVVVTTSGVRQVTALLEEGVPEGVSLLPLAVIGDRALVGPLTRGGRPGCWVCAALRFGANQPPGPAADLWSGLIVPSATATAPSRPLAAMLGNLLAFEVFRLTTGALPPETEEQVIVQDLDSMDCTTEPLSPHPRCPYCAGHSESSEDAVNAASPESAENAESTEAVVPESPHTSSVADADEADDMHDELTARSVLVRPSVGVFTAFDDDTITQLPVKAARIRLGLGHTERRAVTAFDVHHVVGARLSALHRAAEVYAEHVVPPRIADHEDADALDLAIASGNGVQGTTGDGIAAVSLLSGAKVVVPAGAVRTFGPANHDGVYLRTSAGTGAGRSTAEALGRALSTALALDALRSVLTHERTASRVKLPGLDDDAELRFLTESATNLDLGVELLDLTEPDSGFHVLAARAHDEMQDRPVWAVGADVLWRRAAREALRDLVGRVQLGRQEPGVPVDGGDPLIRALDPFALPVEGDVRPTLDAASTWPDALEALRLAGRDAYTAPIGSDDLSRAGIVVTRVLLTGRR
jgi:bacteriocin biosynthesis cyclodehydratase domain-containing protein